MKPSVLGNAKEPREELVNSRFSQEWSVEISLYTSGIVYKLAKKKEIIKINVYNIKRIIQD